MAKHSVTTDTLKKLSAIVATQFCEVRNQLCDTAELSLQMSTVNGKAVYFWHGVTKDDTAEVEKFEKLLIQPIHEQALSLGVNFSYGFPFTPGYKGESHWISSNFETND